jgi:hypothetical protein
MRHLINKIVSIILAATVLYATSSFSVDMHFCCNQLVDIAFFGKAKPCKDKIKESSETSFKKCSFEEKDCCSDRTFLKHADEGIKKASLEMELPTFTFFNVPVHSNMERFEGLKKNIVPFRDYSPPLISKDIQLLQEIFLI